MSPLHGTNTAADGGPRGSLDAPARRALASVRFEGTWSSA
jgi:hypothetical protein